MQGRYLDICMIFLIKGPVYHTANSGVTILMHHFAMLDHMQGHYIVLEDCVHYTKVGTLGPVHVGNKVPDFRNKIGGKVSFDILGVGVVDRVFLKIAQQLLMEGSKDGVLIVEDAGEQLTLHRFFAE